MAEHWLALWEEARSIPQREENQVFRVASVGSVSTYLIRNLRCDVLVVKQQA